MIDAQPYKKLLNCPGLPLALYREVAAHLRQVPGVAVELLPQRSPLFDYRQSQVGGLVLRYSSTAGAEVQTRIEQILTYYGDRYGVWQVLDDSAASFPESLA